VLECAICLQPCVHPVRLPCSHMFCYLCMKGVAVRNRRCALCRADIPEDFVRRPILVAAQEAVQSKGQEPSSDNGKQ
jgi:E3 ubiquitin-protein ligase RNF146